MADYPRVSFIEEILRRYVTRPEQRILDVGCGPGLYRDSTVGEYVGVDRADIYAEPPDILAPAVDLPLEDESFDVVMSKSAFFMFYDHPTSIGEMRRVLRPGGHVILFDYNARAQRALMAKDGTHYRCWTVWGLQKFLLRHGFRDPHIYLPTDRQPTGLYRLAKIVQQELMGQWAIVAAQKPS